QLRSCLCLASRVFYIAPHTLHIHSFPTRRSSDLGAQAFAEGYLEHRQNEAQSVLESTSDRLSEQIEDAEEKFQSETAEASDDERSEEHTSELQSRFDLVCRLLLEKKNKAG